MALDAVGSARRGPGAPRAAASLGAHSQWLLASDAAQGDGAARGRASTEEDGKVEFARSAPPVRYLPLAQAHVEEEEEADSVPLDEFFELPLIGGERRRESEDASERGDSARSSESLHEVPERQASPRQHAESSEDAEREFEVSAAEKVDLGRLGTLLFVTGVMPRPTLLGSARLSRAYSAFAMSVVVGNIVFRFVRAVLSNDDSSPFFVFALLTWAMKLRLSFGGRGDGESSSTLHRVMRLRWDLGWYLHPLIYRRLHRDAMKKHIDVCRSYFGNLFSNMGPAFAAVFFVLIMMPLPYRLAGIGGNSRNLWSSDWDPVLAERIGWSATQALVLASDCIMAAASSASIVLLFVTVEVLRSHIRILYRDLEEREEAQLRLMRYSGPGADGSEEAEVLTERERARVSELRMEAARATKRLAREANVIIIPIVGIWTLVSLTTLIMYATQSLTSKPPSNMFTTLSALVAAVFSLALAIEMDRARYTRETTRVLNADLALVRYQNRGASQSTVEAAAGAEEGNAESYYPTKDDRKRKPTLREVTWFYTRLFVASMPMILVWSLYMILLIEFFFLDCGSVSVRTGNREWKNCSRSDLLAYASTLCFAVFSTNLSTFFTICFSVVPKAPQRSFIGRRFLVVTIFIFCLGVIPLFFLVLGSETYTETESDLSRTIIATLMFVQVLLFLLILWHAFAGSARGESHQLALELEPRSSTAPLVESVGAGPDKHAVSKLCWNFLAWTLVNFSFYALVVFFLLPFVRRGFSGQFVLASRLLGQLALAAADNTIESMLPVLPKGAPVMLLMVSRFLMGFAGRVMIPNVTLPRQQAYLVLWITGLDVAQRMLRPALAAIRERLRRLAGCTRSPNSSLSVTQRAELDAHRVLTLMVAKNLSIVAALVISVLFRALNGIDVFSRALVPIFAMQLVLSCVSDVLCVFMEIRYLRLDLVGVAAAYYLDWRAILAPCLVAVFLAGNVLSPLFTQIFN